MEEMSSYLFHRDPMVAPPPPEFIRLSQQRAMWQAIGVRPCDVTAREWANAVLMLGMESRDIEERSKRGQKWPR